MKRFLISVLVILFCLVSLSACGKDESSSSQSGSSESRPVSDSSESTETDNSSSGTANSVDVESIASDVAQAAGLGETISFKEIDVVAQFGIAKDIVTAFSGVYSQTVSENGGEVLVVQATPGNAAAVESALNDYKETTKNNDLYVEFAKARENVGNARIVVSGDVVVYAASATGTPEALEQLDLAIKTALGTA